MILCLFCNFVNVVHAHHRSMTQGRSGSFEPSPRPTDSDPLFSITGVMPAIPCRYTNPLSPESILYSSSFYFDFANSSNPCSGCLSQIPPSPILRLHLSPCVRMVQITASPLIKPHSPRIVNSQPLPIALMMGSAARAPAKEKMLRTKLLMAMPEEARRGMNSVSMVVESAKISMLPTPKKKLASI